MSHRLISPDAIVLENVLEYVFKMVTSIPNFFEAVCLWVDV
jgi:hypothetical protein